MKESYISQKNLSEMLDLGRSIGRFAKPGDFIKLNGDLGAGKTTLTQAIGQGLGLEPDELASPTFAMVSEYRSGRIPLYHFDLYRLNEPEQLIDLAFDDYVSAGDGLIVVEWAERAEIMFPDDTLAVCLSASQESSEMREVDIRPTGVSAAVLYSALLRALT